MRNHRTFFAILIGLAIAAIAGLAGCSAPGVSQTPSAPGTTATGPGVAGPTAALGGRDAWLVVGRKGAPALEVILASTAEQEYALPNGIPDATWGHVFAAVSDGTRTTLTHLVVQPGFGGPETVIDDAGRRLRKRSRVAERCHGRPRRGRPGRHGPHVEPLRDPRPHANGRAALEDHRAAGLVRL
jgi:hypothetical protein